jgi:hypothetical protein
MVATRIGDNTAGPDGFVEVGDRVERATNLERADLLQALGFDP